MKNTAKTNNFLNAIQKHTDEQREAMRLELEELKKIKLQEAETKGKYYSEKYIADNLEAKRTEETAKIAKLTQENQKKLFLRRAEMTDNIFKLAESKLIDYCKTPKYLTNLLESAKEISNLFSDNPCVLYLNEKDLIHSKEIISLFNGEAELIADNKSIKIGGIKGYCKKMAIVADETLDSKLYAQREWFIENSGLSVL